MPNIRVYNAQSRQLNPTDRALQGWETAGRRVGPLYNQAAEDQKRAGQVLGEMEKAKAWPFDIYDLRASMAAKVHQSTSNETSERGNAGGASLTGGGGGHGRGGGHGGGGGGGSVSGGTATGDDSWSSEEFAIWAREHTAAQISAAGMAQFGRAMGVGESGWSGAQFGAWKFAHRKPSTEENGVAVLRGGGGPAPGGNEDEGGGVTVLQGGRGNAPEQMDFGSARTPGYGGGNIHDDATDFGAGTEPGHRGGNIHGSTSDYPTPTGAEDKIIQHFADKWNLKNPGEKMGYDKAYEYLYPERFLPSAQDERAVEAQVDQAADALQPSWISRGFSAIVGGLRDTFNAATGEPVATAPIPDEEGTSPYYGSEDGEDSDQ